MTSLQRYLSPELLKRLSTISVSARSVVAGMTTGPHRAPVRGSSIEFRQHRFYTPGDEPRRIDWRVLARTDRTYVREYEQETNLRCLLLVDASGSMSYDGQVAREQKLLYARRAAVALAYVMLSQTEAVGLATFGGTTQYVPPAGGQSQLSRLVDAVDRTVAGGGGGGGHVTSSGRAGGGGRDSLESACLAAANRLRRRTLVIVLSDLLSDCSSVARGIGRLVHDRHEVLVARVLHRDEVEFPFRRWHRFIGAEGEGSRAVEPAVARDRYLARFEAHRAMLSASLDPMAVRVVPWLTDDDDLAESIARLVHQRTTRPAPRPTGAGPGGSPVLPEGRTTTYPNIRPSLRRS